MFDDIDKACSISVQTIRQLFHQFITYRRTTLYERYVVTPTAKEEAALHTYEFKQAPGCVSKTKDTHIAMDYCVTHLKYVYKGFKLSLPSRTYTNISANHKRCNLNLTSGHLASS